MDEVRDVMLTIRRSDLLRVLSHLECIVVSLDRIGSSQADNVDELTIAFLDDWNVFGRLAETRQILSGPFPEELGADDMEELERELADVPHWSVNARKPVAES